MSRNIEPRLGVHLLETITRGMYSEPLHSIREYVQNAFDSIRDARSKGILGDTEGTIRILLDRESQSVRVEDDGTGLTPEEAVVWLLDIGRSGKAANRGKSGQHAGFRGIGRMAGISYCDTLTFETSTGDGKVCSVTFDARRINRLTRPGQEPMSISDAIGSSVTVTEAAIEHRERFFRVVLAHVDEGTGFLDDSRMKEYLSEVAPVPYDPREWNFCEDIREMARRAESQESLNTVRVVICDGEGNEKVEIRRPFCDTFEATSRNKKRTITVNNVRPLPSAEGENSHPSTEDTSRGWWGWYAVHSRDAKLGDVAFAGLRIRMHNIAIGDERIVRRLFKAPHLAMWCFGEIHITDSRVVPNAQRDAFEPSKPWSQIEEELRIEAAHIDKMCRKASQERSSAKKRKTEKASLTKSDDIEPSSRKSDAPIVEPVDESITSDSSTRCGERQISSGGALVYQGTITNESSANSNVGEQSSSGSAGGPSATCDDAKSVGVAESGSPRRRIVESPTLPSQSSDESTATESEMLEVLDSQSREFLARIRPVLEECFDDATVIRLTREILTVLIRESEA